MNTTQLSLPHCMRYGIASQQSVKSTCNLRRFDPNNGGTFNSDGSNEIRLSLQAPGFMDTSKHLIQFEITGGHTVAAATLDFDIGCVIDQVRLESMGTVLERLDRYQLFNVAKSSYCGNVSNSSTRQIMSGGAAAAFNVSSVGASIGTTAAAGKTRTFALQLRSGLLVNKHKHALPMGSPPIDLIIRLNKSATALFGASGASGVTDGAYTIKNVRFTCPVYTIQDDNVMDQYRQVLDSQSLNFSGVTFKAYSGTVADDATTATVQINDRSKGLLGLVAMLRTSANLNDIHKTSLSAFNATNLTRYVYNIGGQQYPPGGVETVVSSNQNTNLAQLYDQARRALSDPSMEYCDGLLSITKLCQNNATGATAPKAVLAVDLKCFSDKERSMVGLDTKSNAQPMTLELNFNSTGASGAQDVTVFAISETNFMLQDGRYNVSV